MCVLFHSQLLFLYLYISLFISIFSYFSLYLFIYSCIHAFIYSLLMSCSVLLTCVLVVCIKVQIKSKSHHRKTNSWMFIVVKTQWWSRGICIGISCRRGRDIFCLFLLLLLIYFLLFITLILYTDMINTFEDSTKQ